MWTLLIGVLCFMAGYCEFQPFHLFGQVIERGLISAIGGFLALYSLTYFIFFTSSGSPGASNADAGRRGGTHPEPPGFGSFGSDEPQYSAGDDYPSLSPLEYAPDLDAQFSSFSSSGFHDLNPGSGLPTIGGAGTPDIGGYTWGHGPNDF